MLPKNNWGFGYPSFLGGVGGNFFEVGWKNNFGRWHDKLF